MVRHDLIAICRVVRVWRCNHKNLFSAQQTNKDRLLHLTDGSYSNCGSSGANSTNACRKINSDNEVIRVVVVANGEIVDGIGGYLIP